MVPQTNVMLEMSQNNNVYMVTLLAHPGAGMSLVCLCVCVCVIVVVGMNE